MSFACHVQISNYIYIKNQDIYLLMQLLIYLLYIFIYNKGIYSIIFGASSFVSVIRHVLTNNFSVFN